MSETSRKIEIPESWTWVRLGALADLITKGTTPTSLGYAFTETGVRFIKIENIRGGRIDGATVRNFISQETNLALRRSQLQAGDILFSIAGTIGACAVVAEEILPANTNQALAIIRGISGRVSIEFFRAIAGSFLAAPLKEKARGGAMSNISLKDISDFEIPLPPLAEQKRIVAKIEELFSELEAGEECLRVARRQLGVYRQSLLKQAFEGKLTAQWRTQKPAKLESPADSEIPVDELDGFPSLPASWRYTRFGRSIRHIDAGKSFRCEERRPTPDEIGVAKVSAVTWGEYDEAESKTCIDPEKVNPDYFIRSGDFILSRANTIELVGACVIVRNVTQRVMLSDKTLRLTIDDALKPFFLHYLRSRHGRREIEKRSTGNQESMRNIGQERIRSIIVPECSLPEQQEIVRLLDSAVEVIERNERELDAALKRSEALRQAILKKAFTGRLVPQSPADEPASQLLARLRTERGSNVSASRSRRQTVNPTAP